MIIFRYERISIDVLQLEFSLIRSKLIFFEKAYVKLKQRQNICEFRKKNTILSTHIIDLNKNSPVESQRTLISTKTLSPFSIVSQHFQWFSFIYLVKQ